MGKKKSGAGSNLAETAVASHALLARPQDLRNEQGSYASALVKRAQGGAVVKSGDISQLYGGIERITLIAEDLGKRAVRSPWKLDQLLRMSDSQLDARMDEIDMLKKSDHFYNDILIYLESHVATLPNTEIRHDVTKDASLVASVVGMRIHYAHLIAASWYLLRLQMYGLSVLPVPVDDTNVRNRLHQDRPTRELYMQMFDLADRVVEMERYRFGQMCASCPYYTKFFERVESPDGDRLGFKKDRAGDVFISLTDFLIIQIALPGESPWSIQQLIAMLHEAFADNLKEEAKLSQQVNDALGDLSMAVQFLDMLDVPLTSADAVQWKKQSPIITPEFQAYLDSQDLSRIVLSDSSAYAMYLSPLDQIKDQETLTLLWNAIDTKCLALTDHKLTLEHLWGLELARQPAPTWSFPSVATGTDEESAHLQVVAKTKDGPRELDAYERRVLGLRSLPPPDRLTIEGTKPVEVEEEWYDDEEDDDYTPSASISGDIDVDPHLLDKLLRDALAQAETEGAAGSPFEDLLSIVQHDTDGMHRAAGSAGASKSSMFNPLKRVMDLFRGRSVPKKESPTTAQRPAEPYVHAKKSPLSDLAMGEVDLDDDADIIPALIPYTPPPKVPSAHVETPRDAHSHQDDDQAEPETPAKKKNKKKNKKKSTGPTIADLAAKVQSVALSSTNTADMPPTPPESPVTDRRAAASVSTLDVSRIPSIPVGETVAKSGTTYLRERGGEQGEKVKTRGIQNLEEVRKKLRSWSPFHQNREQAPTDEERTEERAERGVFSAVKRAFHLPIRDDTAEIMRRILHAVEISTEEDDDETATDALARGPKVDRMRPMKWKDFVKGMVGMGFSVVGNTAGSSVRFDPPNANDRSIMVHRPHPKAEYAPNQLRRIGWRLKKHYGWMAEDFRPWEEKA